MTIKIETLEQNGKKDKLKVFHLNSHKIMECQWFNNIYTLNLLVRCLWDKCKTKNTCDTNSIFLTCETYILHEKTPRHHQKNVYKNKTQKTIPILFPSLQRNKNIYCTSPFLRICSSETTCGVKQLIYDLIFTLLDNKTHHFPCRYANAAPDFCCEEIHVEGLNCQEYRDYSWKFILHLKYLYSPDVWSPGDHH